jgi:hypothetical protein
MINLKMSWRVESIIYNNNPNRTPRVPQEFAGIQGSAAAGTPPFRRKIFAGPEQTANARVDTELFAAGLSGGGGSRRSS